MKRFKLALAGAAALLVAGAGASAWATHSWGGYHWSVNTYPFNMRVGDNVTSTWDGYLDGAVSDWDSSSVLALTKVTGATNPRNCKPVSGRIEVCNSAYGNTGWLGIAQIWLSGGHITQGVTKLNDTYFKTAKYNTPSWRALVTCQEIGHDFGLGHQDENFATDATNSCMDYTNLPGGNEHPDSHDYGQLETIYGHTHTAFTTITASGTSPSRAPSEQAGGNSRADWGQPIHYTADGAPDIFVKEIAPGRKMLTHVFWTEEARRKER